MERRLNRCPHLPLPWPARIILRLAVLGLVTITPDESVAAPQQRTMDHRLPTVELKSCRDAVELWINRRQMPPFFFAWAGTEPAPTHPKSFEVARQMYDAGVRLFSPCMAPLPIAADGTLEFAGFDAVMAKLTEECPEGYFLPRLGLRPPPDLPPSDKIQVARRPGDFSDAKQIQISPIYHASLSSERYRQFAPLEMEQVLRHIRSRPYATRVIGMIFGGGGFEGNWGQPQGDFGLYMDVSSAVTAGFGKWLEAKYGSVNELRMQWGRADVDFQNPPLPGIEERTMSDLAGFRDPSKPASRWVTDFLDFYGDEGTHAILPVFDKIQQVAPRGFFGVYHLFTFTTQQQGTQMTFCKFLPLLDHPGLGFMAGCLTYVDRKAGGVSVYTNFAWDSLRWHGKLALAEADIRTPVYRDSLGDDSYELTIQSMRREFGHVILTERQAMWYFDMGVGQGWYEDERLLREVGEQVRIVRAAQALRHRNVAETLVVIDNYSWRYFAYSSSPLQRGENIPLGNCQYLLDAVHYNIENLMRMGAPSDAIIVDDLLRPEAERYKFYIFPAQFHCDQRMRDRIKFLVARKGATALFTGGAGIVNETNASLENMRDLLGMTIAVDKPASLAASWVNRTHPIGQGLPPNFVVGDLEASGHRFFVDDPEAVPLARFADGKVAMAVKRMGKGHVVYSSVPLIQPAIYRNVARFAGVHIYSDSDDALYADNNFLVIHTRTAGTRTIRLLRRSEVIGDIFTGAVAARNSDSFRVDLPANTTVIYALNRRAMSCRPPALNRAKN